MAAEIDSKLVGQALAELPLHTMIKDTVISLAQAQKELDANSFEQLKLVAEEKVVVPTQAGGLQEVSLLSLGLVPSFYHMAEFNISATVSIRYEVSDEKKVGIGAGFGLSYSNGREVQKSWERDRFDQYAAIKNTYGEYAYSAYISNYNEQTGEFTFISNEVIFEKNGDELTLYLSKEQVENYRYKHEGLLWRPRIYFLNNNEKIYIAALKLDGSEGKIVGVSDATLQGKTVLKVTDFTGLGLPQVNKASVAASEYSIPNSPTLFLEDPQQATTPISVKYSVQVYSNEQGTQAQTHSGGKSLEAFKAEIHYGMIYFGFSDTAGQSLADMESELEPYPENDSSSDPDEKGGVLDVGRGYKQENAILLDSPAPTNIDQCRDNNTDLKNEDEDFIRNVLETKHRLVAFCKSNSAGELNIYAGKYKDDPGNNRDASEKDRIGHGCYYDKRSIISEDFFKNIPSPVAVDPIPVPPKQGISEQIYAQKASGAAVSGYDRESASQSLKDSNKRFAVAVAANVDVQTARRYEFDMSMCMKLDARVNAVSAPMPLLEKFSQMEAADNGEG
ncbi:hypothetical protein [Marinibactrum halimedae]|uniref:Uncharacterized protein n=1 Tax=Marinibactrum halimedae TaxID=1444977 RepID=A0AA37T3N6_9GAMM|nr:hypothetical protein [Marinibactrum halimedae]MCD9460271.1 hypothetical protein [Marinibactrum halimedae]GLS24358.1 hypothetical protein GCM10007877_00690 [Marinibactrum halimedae]